MSRTVKRKRFKPRVLMNKKNANLFIQTAKKTITIKAYSERFGGWMTLKLFHCKLLGQNFIDLGDL